MMGNPVPRSLRLLTAAMSLPLAALFTTAAHSAVPLAVHSAVPVAAHSTVARTAHSAVPVAAHSTVARAAHSAVAIQPPGELSGLVAEQGTLLPVVGAVVTLYRSTPDGALDPAGTTTTDEDGAFRFSVSTGDYRVQAEHNGLSSPLSAPVSTGGGSGLQDVVLFVPSPLLMLAASCDQEVEPGTVIVGVLRDGASEVPIPGGRVRAEWEGDEGPREVDAESDAAGRYRLCGAGTQGFIRIRAEALGRAGEWAEVEVARPALVFHDIEMPLASAAADLRSPGANLRITAARGVFGDLRGVLRDRDTGAPITQAVIHVEGTGHQALTDGEGRFSFNGLTPGRYTLRVQHLGYSVQTSEVELPEGHDVALELALSPRAIELAGFEVRARSRLEQDIRISPFRRQVVAAERLARAELRGADMTSVLRSELTGVVVREIYDVNRGTILCVGTNRRVARLQPTGERCAQAQLIVDGIRIGGDNISFFLRDFAISDIESIEFMNPVQATTLYGTGGNVANGVLVIHTRGKGPYVSEGRNR